MAILLIPLSDDRLLKLKKLAQQAKTTPEELVRVSLEEWLSCPSEGFSQAAEYVLQKNMELHRRLV